MSIRGINNLQLLCSRKMCTVKDVQAEAVLCMAHSLIANYLYAKEEPQKVFSKSYLLDKEDENKILIVMKELFEYLTYQILTYPRMQEILNDAGKNPHSTMKARLVEPIGFFYNELSRNMQSRLNYLYEHDEHLIYIPDMLVVMLILDFKEKASYSFAKYEFFKDNDLNELAEIYFKYNSKIRKEQDIEKNAHILEQTNIKKMSHLSMFMIEQLLKSNYNKSFRDTIRKK